MSKLIDLYDLASLMDAGRMEGKRYAMPIGRFNLPRPHHFCLFEEAAQNGIIVVAMNSDSSLATYMSKNGRHTDVIFPAEYRAELLSESPHVEYVTLFNELNAVRPVLVLRPHEIWKGPDYMLETIDQDERRVAELVAAEIKFGKHYAKQPVNVHEWLANYERRLHAK